MIETNEKNRDCGKRNCFVIESAKIFFERETISLISSNKNYDKFLLVLHFIKEIVKITSVVKRCTM